MEYDVDDIINILIEDDNIREEIIYWLNDNGYLNELKLGKIENYDEDF